MRPAAFDSSLMRASVFCACSTASPAMRLESCTWRLISRTDADSSSVAPATDSTLDCASCEADATVVDSCWVDSAIRVMPCADASSSVEADDTVPTISPIAASKSPASLFMVACRSAATRSSAALRSASARASAAMRASSARSM